MVDALRKQMSESANRLREIRLAMGLSQEKFAEYLDISLSAYKKIESAENGISVNVLRKLKDKFSISSDYILYGDYKSTEGVLDFLQNCSDADKMIVFLRLTKYFVNDKKMTYIDSQSDGEDDSKEILGDIFKN